MNIDNILKSQKEFFERGTTLDLKFRKDALKKLYAAIKKNEENILTALKSDLGKSDFEGFMCEIGMMLSEISFLIKNLKKFAKDKRVKTPLAQFKSKSYIKSCPFGNVLIMSPWNYPLLLTLEPLADAIAAGNTAIIKPSAYSPATSLVIKNMLEEIFPAEFVAVVTGGRKENSELLRKKFNLIFFTGSGSVGKEVLKNAAEHLTPVVLELGGKSPCIVDASANIPLAAKRIVFGKYLNCGQTCVAPDYILCHRSVKGQLVDSIKSEITAQFGENPLTNPDYGKIINEKHFERLSQLIDSEKTVFGGKTDSDTLKISPTLMDIVGWEDKIMEEEIFGPILPVLTFSSLEEIYDRLLNLPRPLALYLFTEDKKVKKEVTSRILYGGGCINDTVIHLATSNMPFGGVGESGMGNYHGKAGFDTFSHKKSIVDKSTKIDLKMRYQPYDRKKALKLIKNIMK